MFTLANWAEISVSLNQGQETVTPYGDSATVLNSQNIFSYASPNDGIATITTAGYFNAQSPILSVGDWILINDNTGAGYLYLVLSNTAGVVTLSSIGSTIAPLEVSGNFLIGTAANALTAHAGGGQASATPLTAMIDNVTIVATAGDSVLLPASIAGMQVTVINDAANAMQVYGAGTDTIDDVATATGVSQIGKSTVIYASPVTGKWYSLGLGLTFSAGGLPLVSTSNALTAHSGGGQASALQLTAVLNRVTTVAAAADSVKLPASVAGMIITVVNNGANVMQVFGAGTDTINGVATATGVPQQPNSVVRYVSAVAGLWQAESLPFGYSGAYETVSAATSLTAHSGGTQAAALNLTSAVNEVTTVAAAGDSVRLPASAAGMEITITNSGANSMQVYGAGTDTINGVTTATGVAQLPGQTVVYTCSVAGNWLANISSVPNPVQFVSVPMTAAQFNGMYAAPYQLIPAPGANKMIVVESMELVMTFVSADYAAGGIVFAQYDSTADGAGVKATNTEAAADFFAAASTVFSFLGTSGNTVGALPFSTCANKGLYLSNATQAFTTGDSTWVVKVYYRVISLTTAL